MSEGEYVVKPSTHHALPIGGMIEEFRIIRVLGAGGFGIVYECENTYLPETVAIKEFLPPELACRMPDGGVLPLSPQTEENFSWARDRFLQEAKTLWELARPNRHPNIVRVTRYCEANGTAYMFMEFEQGRPLSGILEAQTRLSPQELEGLFYPLLDGLERVHAAGVVHRDIKPANILIRADGTPVLIDFGAARHVVAGVERSIVSAYTPVYAAVEQYLDAGEQGPWTDIYSFGATLYQAVTGRKPLSASERLCGGVQPLVAEECQGLYPTPILVGIDRALALKPEERPQSVAEWRRIMLEAAGSFSGSERTVVMPTAGPYEPTRLVARPQGQAEAPSKPIIAHERESRKAVVNGSRSWLRGLLIIVLLLSTATALYFRDALMLFFASTIQESSTKRVEPASEDRAATEKLVKEKLTTGPVAKDQESAMSMSGSEAGRSAEEQAEADRSRQRRGDAGQGSVGRDLVELERSEIGQPDQLGVEPEKALREAPGGVSTADARGETSLAVRERIFPGSRFADTLAGGGAGPVMVWLPGGEFQMGSPPAEVGRNPDERLHSARIPQPFAVSETEITLGQFRRFVEDTGYRTEVDRESTCLRPDESWQQLVPDMLLTWESPGYQVADRYPVTCVSWNDASAYAAWLTARTGHQYRLPTEMEWEYAARAGTQTSRFWGDDPDAGCKFANTAECTDDHRYSAPAGVHPPNSFGLRDLLGNVAEWTCSDYGKGYGGAESRCSESSGRSARVFRGGSWLDAPELVRSAARDGAPANLGLNTVGFRLVRLPAVSAEAADAAATR